MPSGLDAAPKNDFRQIDAAYSMPFRDLSQFIKKRDSGRGFFHLRGPE